jgi:hypothetical protein
VIVVSGQVDSVPILLQWVCAGFAIGKIYADNDTKSIETMDTQDGTKNVAISFHKKQH